MNILILGAGALGSLIGARLSATEARVALYSTNEQHMQAIRENGLVVEELDGTMSHFTLETYNTDNLTCLEQKTDIVIVTVKSYATDKAVAKILPICRQATLFLTLQNGIGNWECIADKVGRERILLGTTAQGATFVKAGRIRHGGNGPTFIGKPGGPPTPGIEAIVNIFKKAGLATQSSEHMEYLVWEKLMVNVGINAITALTNIRNGMIAEREAGRALSRNAVLEALQVARAKGFSFGDEEKMVEKVLSVARATAANRSSMGQDVDRKKRTEIDAINGAIVHFADEAYIDAPVNRTLTQLIKVMESSYLKCSN